MAYTKIEPGFRDVTIIPDLWNTGVNNVNVVNQTLKVPSDAYIPSDCNRADITNGAGYYLRADTARNQNLTDGETYVFSNWDLSDKKIELRILERFNVTFVFNNCKLYSVNAYSGGFLESDHEHYYKFILNDCTILGGIGQSNITCNRCIIGNHPTKGGCDGSDPVYDMHFNDCYFYNNHANLDPNAGAHIDGLQFYGATDNLVSKDPKTWDIKYYTRKCSVYNCRFTIPDFKLTRSAGRMYVNSAIALAPDYRGLDEVNINHVLADVASAYGPFRDADTYGLSLHGGIEHNPCTDLKWNDVKASNQYSKPFYGEYGVNSTVTNVGLIDKLYVSTVKKENGKIKFMVTNTTVTARELKVITDAGVTTIKIGRCPTQIELLDSNNTEYDNYSIKNMPYNLNYEVGGTKFAVFFDDGEQIRFANFTNEAVSIDKDATGVFINSDCNYGLFLRRRALIAKSYIPESTAPQEPEENDEEPQAHHTYIAAKNTTYDEEFKIVIDNLELDHTYRISYDYEITVQAGGDYSGTNYIRQRTLNAGAFYNNSLKLSSIVAPLTSSTVLSGSVSGTVTAVRSDTSGRYSITSDHVPIQVSVTNFIIDDITE